MASEDTLLEQSCCSGPAGCSAQAKQEKPPGILVTSKALLPTGLSVTQREGKDHILAFCPAPQDQH